MSTSPGTGHVRNVLAPVTPLTQRPAVAPPEPLTRFIGRENDVATACALLQRADVRLLTLAGPGGIGKTRLALAVAARLRTQYAGNVAWTPLAAIRDPHQVLPAIAQALGIITTHPASLADQIPATLHDRRMLLILDNVEQVVAASPDVAGILMACPGLTVLATSREPLRISGEQILPVPPLDLPDPTELLMPDQLAQSAAVRLFAERAQATAPGFGIDATTAPVVAGICRRLDGLPLAIELAAARLYQLPLFALYDRLERRLPLLTGGPRDAPARLQTMRDAIAWSYDLLSPTEQVLFRALAAFAGGFTLDAVDAVGGEPSLDGLIALVDKSLIRLEPDAHAGPRYTMLEMVREFAAERLTESGDESAVRQRHAAFFQQLALMASEDMATSAAGGWGDRLEADHENVLAALAWLERSGQWLDFVELVRGMGRFWDFRGYLSEGRDWMERALGPAQASSVPLSLRAVVTVNLGLFVLRLGDYDRAEVLLEDARAMWLELGEAGNLAWLHMMLGGVAEYRGDDERAKAWYEASLAGYRAQGDVAGISETLNNLADTAYRRVDLDEAGRLARESLAVARSSSLPVETSAALITIGAIASARGDGSRAIAAHREALTLSLGAAHQLNVADAIAGLAEVAAITSEPERAARLLGAVEAITGRLGVPRVQHHALHRRAMAAASSRLLPEELLAAIALGRTLSQDEVAGECEAVTGALVTPVSIRLTRREADVLRLLVAGATDRAIGEELFIGTRTVESHVARIFEKLGVRTRAAAVTAAITSGLVAPPPPPAADG